MGTCQNLFLYLLYFILVKIDIFYLYLENLFFIYFLLQKYIFFVFDKNTFWNDENKTIFFLNDIIFLWYIFFFVNEDEIYCKIFQS